MVKLSQTLPGNVEYFSLLFIKGSTKLLKWSQKTYFYFSILWNPQFLCSNNFEIGWNYLMVKLYYVGKKKDSAILWAVDQ